MKTCNDCCIFDGQLIAEDEPVVSAHSRGLMYGDGVFETFRSYSGQTLHLAEHLNRLEKGLSFLGITPPPAIERNQLISLVQKLLSNKNLMSRDAILRLQVWRDGNRGYLPDKDAQSHFSILASRCPYAFDNPKLVTINHRRIPSEAMPSSFKLANGINYILASREAEKKGAHDALMQTVEGWISETTIGNLFWIKRDRIYTPSSACDLLPGVTRKIVINLVQQMEGLSLQKGQFQLEHLLDADTLFMTNSVRELIIAEKLNETNFDVQNQVFLDLKTAFNQYRTANLKSL